MIHLDSSKVKSSFSLSVPYGKRDNELSAERILLLSTPHYCDTAVACLLCLRSRHTMYFIHLTFICANNLSTLCLRLFFLCWIEHSMDITMTVAGLRVKVKPKEFKKNISFYRLLALKRLVWSHYIPVENRCHGWSSVSCLAYNLFTFLRLFQKIIVGLWNAVQILTNIKKRIFCIVELLLNILKVHLNQCWGSCFVRWDIHDWNIGLSEPC